MVKSGCKQRYQTTRTAPEIHPEGCQIGGRWSEIERGKHINALELKATLFALKAFSEKIVGKHIKVLTGNSTAASYINNMGGTKSELCNSISKEIWSWCIEKNIWLSCSHIAGKSNEADAPSRKFNDMTDNRAYQVNRTPFLYL